MAEQVEDDEGEAAEGPPAPRRPPERWAVAAQRASGLVLLVVVPTHLALTRVLADPADATVPVVRDRWMQPGWRLLECLLVVAAAVHVIAVTRVSLSRSGLGGEARTAVLAAVAVVSTAVAVFASALVLTAPW